MSKLRKKLLLNRIGYVLYNIFILSVAFIFDRFFQMLIFILFFNFIQNCFRYRFHADTIFPNEPIKAVKYCKVITIVVEVVYLLFCKEFNVSIYSNLAIVFLIALVNALLQFYLEKFFINAHKLSNKEYLLTICQEKGISKLSTERMIKRYVEKKTIKEIASEEFVEAETIKQSIRRTKRKLEL